LAPNMSADLIVKRIRACAVHRKTSQGSHNIMRTVKGGLEEVSAT
jgi:hypothetical protein